MQKLVYTYEYSDYECSGSVIEPFEYESGEQFLLDMDALIQKYKIVFGKYQQAGKELYRTDLSPKMREIYWASEERQVRLAEYLVINEELAEVQKTRLGGIMVPLADLAVENEYVSTPEVFTLEEWFEKFKATNGV